MKTIPSIFVLAVTLAFGGETNLTLTVDGVTYNNVRFGRATPASVTVFHSTGVATIPLEKLTPQLQQQFGYDPQKAAEWQAAQQKAEAERQAAQWQAAYEAAEARRKAAATVQWTLTVERILPDGIIARGRRTGDARVSDSSSRRICLVEDPKVGELAEGNKFTANAYKEGVITIAGRVLEKWVYYEPMPQKAAQQQATQQAVAASLSELRQKGAFGFPQKDAKVLWNQPALRFSVWNNDQYLFAQAVLWTDGDASLGKTDGNEETGDSSKLMLDLDANGEATPNVDRHYWLNRWPSMRGLHYQISLSARGRTGMKHDSQGRGAIRYVETSDGKRVRVDTYLIPLAEISKQVGDTIRLCYWGYSPKPPLTVSSIGYEATGPISHSDNVSFSKASAYVLTTGGQIDVAEVPDGRADTSSSER